jgi:hypothetical protein
MRGRGAFGWIDTHGVFEDALEENGLAFGVRVLHRGRGNGRLNLD